MDVVQVYGIALEKGEYDSSDYANSLNWLWSRMKDIWSLSGSKCICALLEKGQKEDSKNY